MKHMYRINIIVALLVIVAVTGCSYKQTNTQIRDTAFLKFTKSSTQKYTVVINDQYTFNLDSCTLQIETGQCYDDTTNKLYKITSGKFTIKVYDQDTNLILQKEHFIGSSNTMEINLQ